MIHQNQLQSLDEKMVDLLETEELESRLEMCGSWYEDPCATNDGGDSRGSVSTSTTVSGGQLRSMAPLSGK